MQFLHTMLRVKNTEKALQFYTQLLEMEVVKEKTNGTRQLYFLTDKNEVAQIELEYDANATKKYDIGNGFGHLGFKVDSMKEFEDKVEKLGYEFSRKPYKVAEKGSTIGFIEDPDGYEIEIIEKYKE